MRNIRPVGSDTTALDAPYFVQSSDTGDVHVMRYLAFELGGVVLSNELNSLELKNRENILHQSAILPNQSKIA